MHIKLSKQSDIRQRRISDTIFFKRRLSDIDTYIRVRKRNFKFVYEFAITYTGKEYRIN